MKKHLQHILSLLAICCTMSVAGQVSVPSDLIKNCNQWKITYPTGKEDKTLCNEPNNEYFYVNTAGDAIVFRTPIRSSNATTPNSSYIRSELRERTANGNSDIYWKTAGTHMVYVKQAITHLPMNKPHLVATQIHGNKDDRIDDAMVLRLEDSHLFLSFNGGKLRRDVTVKSNYSLGTIHEVIFLVVDGKHYCYYSEDGNLLNAYNKDSADSYLIKDGPNDFVMDKSYGEAYFKIGNYTQSNADKEGTDTGNPNNYGEVLVYDFEVEHGAVKFTGISLSPANVAFVVGSNIQLAVAKIPTDATENIDVSFTSSDSTIASVDSKGLVTAILEGTVSIIGRTDDGRFIGNSTITVVGEPTGPNLALNKPISGTGTHDADNEVANLVDGLTSKRWSVLGFPQSATIDLGAVYSIGRTETSCYKDRDYQYMVSVANEESGPYTQIVDRFNNSTLGSVRNPIIDVFPIVEGRYIQITVTGAHTYTGSWMSLLEFRVFGGSETSNLKEIGSIDEPITIWPNPAGNTINFNASKGFQLLEVYDQLGKLVMNQTLEGTSVDISKLNPGLYVFKLSGKNGAVSERVFKRKY